MKGFWGHIVIVQSSILSLSIIHYTKLCSFKKPLSFGTGASWLSGAGLGYFAFMVTDCLN